MREHGTAITRRGAYRETAWVPQTIPAYLISTTVASDLLVGSGYTLDELSLRFTPTPLSTTVRMAVSVTEQENVTARNVLGLLPGSDPDRRDEVVIIGAHYDHLGPEPDGAVINGANDNASGVSAMLEIARLWHTQGYRPARSVLFAAWDGEELGLLGSAYYVQHPTRPLTRTVAVINLDMVGAGETLRIDGPDESPLVAQLQAAAATYGISATHMHVGRSDHVSFLDAGIPAAMLIYWPDVYYHTVNDEFPVVAAQPEKLRAAGVLAAHTLAALANTTPELEATLTRLQASILAGDRDAFLALLDPHDPDLRVAQAAWFDHLWSRPLVQATMEPKQVRVQSEEALVTLKVAYRWADAQRATTAVTYDVRFVRRDGYWFLAGQQPEEEATDGELTVARMADVPLSARQLLTATARTYATLSAAVGVTPTGPLRVVYYPDAPTLRAQVRPAATDATLWLIPSPQRIEIAWGHPITPALTHLLLDRLGLSAGQGRWLREGLTAHLQQAPGGGGYENEPGNELERKYLPVLETTDLITPLLTGSPELTGEQWSGDTGAVLRAYAWSAVDYLLDRYGLAGLRALCTAWGASGDPARAFPDAFGLSLQQFETDWRTDRIAALRADDRAIQALLTAQADAALSGDTAAYLATINPQNALLSVEARRRMAAFAHTPPQAYTLTGHIVHWNPVSGTAIVEMTTEATFPNPDPAQANAAGRTYRAQSDVRFVRRGDGWRYDGIAWEERAGEHVVLLHAPHRDPVEVEWILDQAESVYRQVVADLGVTLSRPPVIALYEDAAQLRADIAPAPEGTLTAWTAPGEAVKVLYDSDERALRQAIAQGLTRHVLFAYGGGQGIRADWLHLGLADFEAGQVIPLGSHWMAGRYIPILEDALRRHKDFPLYDLPTLANPDLHLQGDSEAVALLRAQSWSLVAAIAEPRGLPGLRSFLTHLAAGEDVAGALRSALNVDPDTFQESWRAQYYNASAPPDLVAMARRFDADRAWADIAVLAGPECAGREAGTPGGERAATFIAARFADLGLVPILPTEGMPPTLTLTTTSEMTATWTYWQRFPISHTQLLTVPTFALVDEDGTLQHTFGYLDEFIERAGQGTAMGELVYVRQNAPLEELRFGGAIVFQNDVRFSPAYVQKLQERGAGGVIIATDKSADELLSERLAALRSGNGGEEDPTLTIPVFEIGDVARTQLLEELGVSARDLSFAPPTWPLGRYATLRLTRSPVTRTTTANLLALWPGSDPDLADEVLLVGAHYDHAGHLPNQLYFPGANQNASGVAALLEVARVWREAGFRPARSVLFVAWGAEEKGSAGAAHYLSHPAIPLTRTVGVIALDAIAGGRGYSLMFHGTKEHDLPLIQRTAVSAAELDRRAWREGNTGEGWHEAFNAAGVPTLKLIWDDAEMDFYSLDDTAAHLDRDRLANSGEVLTLALAWLAGR